MLWFWRSPARSSKKRPPRRSLKFESLESRSLLATIAPLTVPPLSSRPGASASLYLDFNGHVEPRWGNHTNVTTPVYDTDGNKSSFSSAEQAAIREIWTRVAEDYAPFNINVTTVAPPVIADRVAARVAIGGSYSDWYGSSAGGVSYVGGFAGPASNVAYVFSSTLGSGNPRYVAEAISHESGHLMGLEHQAAWSGTRLIAEYSSGTSALAPIMGIGYYSDRTTWSNGTTTDSSTAKQDDMALIASATNGFGYVADDYGNGLSTASPLPVSATNINVAGLINNSSDRDVFKFTTSGGKLSFVLDAAQFGANLDAVVELQNAAGQSIVVANPSTSYGASLSATVAAGSYYLVVRSTGGYGNLGRYALHGAVPAGGTTSTSTTTTPSSTTSSSTTTTTTSPTTSTSTTNTLTTYAPRIADNGSAQFTSTGSWKILTGVGYSSDTQYAAVGSGATSTWTFTGLSPGKYSLAGAWQASALNATDAPFSISNGSSLLSTVRLNQQRAANSFSADGATWQNLGTFTITGSTLTVRLNATATGRVVADALRLQRVA